MQAIPAHVVAVADHRPVRAWIDTSALVARGVLVRQDVTGETNRLVGYTVDGRQLKRLPGIQLRGVLRVQLDGIDNPVTLCARRAGADSLPCLSVSDVGVDTLLARLDADGTLRFANQLPAVQTAALADSARRLHVPLVVSGDTLTALDLPLRFETPKNLVLRGRASGGAGPDLRLEVQSLVTGRIGYTVYDAEDHVYRAVVERSAADSFHVISEGADGQRGADGSTGADGMSGSMGTSAMCPSFSAADGGRGEDGRAGQDGGIGGDGGRGGNITVDVKRGSEGGALLAIVRHAISSDGGAGGDGGSGGRGGRGGAGGLSGSGTTCFDAAGIPSALPGGSSGQSGVDGISGAPGTPGSRGGAGRITIRMTP